MIHGIINPHDPGSTTIHEPLEVAMQGRSIELRGVPPGSV